MDERLNEAIDGFVAGNSSLRSTVIDLLAIADFDDWCVAADSAFRNVRACAVVAAVRRNEPELPDLVGSLYEPGHADLADGFIEALNQERSWRLAPSLVVRLLSDRNEGIRLAACREAHAADEVFDALVERVIDGDESSEMDNASRDALIEYPPETTIDRLTARLTDDGPNVLVWVLDRVVERHGLLADGHDDQRFAACSVILRNNAYTGWCPTLRRKLGVKTAVVPNRFKGFGSDLAADLAEGTAPPAHLEPEDLAAVRELLLAEEGGRTVLLNGPTGVGKTAFVHALAAALEPDGWAVLRMSPSDFLVGTKYLGEWQSRVEEVLGLLRRPAQVILYVPEVDGLLAAGRSSSADISVMDQLLPAIEAGDIALIGETTPDAFAKGLGAHPSIAAVFNRFEVQPAGDERTMELCRAVAAEAGVVASDEVLVRTRELAESFRGSIAEPGRSLGLLRRAVQLIDDDAPLDVRSVLTALSESTGIPVDLLDDNAALDLAATRRFIGHRVMGQPEAVDHAVDVVTLIKAGLTDPQRPNSVMLFVGPTGVGKTELAKALAEQLFGDPKRMVRLDMSEFATYESYERLLGVHRPGLLTEPVRLQPFSVVLLDEIEKGHANVFDLCLQLFDDGRLTDGSGRTVDFRNSIIIMTSNVGSKIRTEPAAGFGRAAPETVRSADILRELDRFFRPEFLNRIDRIVTFDPLSLEVAERVTRREVAAVLARSGIARRRIAIDLDEQVVDLLLRDGYSPALGARPLKRVVERSLLLPVAREIATHRVGRDGVLHIGVREGKIVVSRIASPSAVSAAADDVTLPDLDALDAGLAVLADVLEPLRSERTAMLEATSDPEFWNDPARQATLDRIQRIDTLVERFDRLGDDVERTRSNRNQRRRATFVAAHDAELRRLRAILADGGLDDAFVAVSLLPGSPSVLGAVELVTRMYYGLAERWRFGVSVVDDHVDAQHDTVTLLVSGPGASTLLAAERGVHRFRRLDDSVRETVRVEVLPVPSQGPDAADLLVRRHPIDSPARIGARRTLELDVGLRSVPGRVVVWTTGDPSAVEDAGLLLLARQSTERAEPSTVVRRYDFGDQPLVKDSRTGRTTGRLADVLRGDLDRFLLVDSAFPAPAG